MKMPQETTPRFGANPKKITCRCNAEEMDCEVITIQMNGRCPVCDSLYQISIPKSTIQGLEQLMKKQAVLLDIDRREPQPVEPASQLVYRSSDWETGVLAL